MKKIILSALAVLLTTGLFAQIQNYNVGDVVDDFTVTDTDGNTWNLYDITSQGKVVYLDFFFDTCPPCQVTTPIFNEFYDRYGCNEGEIFAISINNGTDNDAEVIAFENAYGGSFEHAPAVSNEGGAGAVDTNFNPTAYPTYCLIGTDNTLLIHDIWPINNVGTFENTFGTAGINPDPMPCTELGTSDNLLVDFNVYPNPNPGSEINIALGNDVTSADVTIYNVLGSVVYTNSFSQNVITIDTNLSSGSYIISISTEAGTANKSLVVK